MKVNWNFPEIADIKYFSDKAGWDLKKLSDITEIGYWSIRRIVNGETKPKYDDAKKIFTKIQNVAEVDFGLDVRQAKDLMVEDIVSFKGETEIENVTKVVKEKNITQFPVFHNNRVIGTITTGNINDKKEYDMYVRDCMSEPLPIFAQTTHVYKFASLFRHYNAILLSDTVTGMIVGIITAMDMIIPKEPKKENSRNLKQKVPKR